jgi:DNA (cytosine-5)-methyltransferase 1
VRIVDLFCGAGGAAMGLHRVFPEAEIVGIDIAAQPRYPFRFVRMDWLRYLEISDPFDFAWASPKCQRHSTMTARWDRQHMHENQIPAVREKLRQFGKPYVIENVPQAPLENPVLLCGSMFGLGVRRHRHFECSFPVLAPECQHDKQPEIVGVYGHAGGRSHRDGIVFKGTDAWKEAMGIDWMIGNELAQAIPPAYSEYIARQF